MIRRTINVDIYAFGAKEANHKGHYTLNTFEYNCFCIKQTKSTLCSINYTSGKIKVMAYK
jgi:hypothetical protein